MAESARDVGVLIVGGGLAGASCAAALREEGYDGSVLVVGREPDPPYERPPASKDYLRGDIERDDALVHPPAWWDENSVELLTRTSVMKLDTGGRVAQLSTKESVRYDRALLACGANVRRLRVDGGGLEGLHYLRTLGNSDSIRADAEQAERVVLVGGSYIACEVAASLTASGRSCTMVMPEALPLSTRLRRDGRALLRRPAALARRRARDRRRPGALRGRRSGSQRVVTESGRSVDADLVVLGTGAVPDVMLARSAGLELGESGGVRCSDRLATSAPGLWAAGDLCEYDSVLHGTRMRIEHFEVAAAQGAAAARAMLGTRRPVRRGALLLVGPRRLVLARVRRPGVAMGSRGRARLARRRRVHDLLPRGRPAGRGADRRTLGRPRGTPGAGWPSGRTSAVRRGRWRTRARTWARSEAGSALGRRARTPRRPCRSRDRSAT